MKALFKLGGIVALGIVLLSGIKLAPTIGSNNRLIAPKQGTNDTGNGSSIVGSVPKETPRVWDSDNPIDAPNQPQLIEPRKVDPNLKTPGQTYTDDAILGTRVQIKETPRDYDGWALRQDPCIAESCKYPSDYVVDMQSSVFLSGETRQDTKGNRWHKAKANMQGVIIDGWIHSSAFY